MSWRIRLAQFVESAAVQRTIIALIIVNAITLGMETSDVLMREMGPALIALDRIFLAIFVVEITARVVAYGLKFFRDAWSVFDFLVVGIALMPATGPFSVLRPLRVLRVREETNFAAAQWRPKREKIVG